MRRPLRVEIKGRDEFWDRAFQTEWEHQFPDRKLTRVDGFLFQVEPEWLNDLERIGTQCFCSVVEAPEDLERRRWIRSIIPRRGD